MWKGKQDFLSLNAFSSTSYEKKLTTFSFIWCTCRGGINSSMCCALIAIMISLVFIDPGIITLYFHSKTLDYRENAAIWIWDSTT